MYGCKPRTALAALALLIAYGSLYPFNFVAPVSVQASLSAFIFGGHWWTSRGDEIGNVALFIPLGVAAAISLPRGRLRPAHIGLLFLACAGLSFVIQVMQIYFPPREAELADVLSNSVGALLGMSCGLFFRRTMHARLPHLEQNGWVLLLILAALMLGDLWPFVPSINFQSWKDSVKPLFISPSWSWTSFLFHLVAVYFAAELIGCIASPSHRRRFLMLFVAAIFIGKVAVVGQSLQPAFVLGSLAGLMTLPLFHRLDRTRPLWLLGLLFATYTFRSLLPLRIRDEPSPISWIPFASMLDGGMDVNAASLGNSIYFFLGMSWLVARMHGRVVGSAVLLAVWSGALEFTQCWLVDRTPDITPPILALAAGLAVQWAGVRAESSALRSGNEPHRTDLAKVAPVR